MLVKNNNATKNVLPCVWRYPPSLVDFKSKIEEAMPVLVNKNNNVTDKTHYPNHTFVVI